MWIVNRKEKSLGEAAIKNKESYLLNAELINSMGHIIAVDSRGSKYDVESICVQTSLVRFDVCGLIQTGDVLDFQYFIGDDGVKINADDLFNE